MNVVPVSGFNTLPVIYDRGLIGVMHDWYGQCTFCFLILTGSLLLGSSGAYVHITWF